MPKKPEVFSDSPEAVEAKITELERKLERLRTSYESYFMGTERTAPASQRREMNRLVLEMQQIYIRKAALRFRFQTVMQRWSLFTSYWNRTMREIEAGTYRRDLARVQRLLADRGEALTEEQAIALGIPSRRAKAFIAQHNRKLAARGLMPGAGTPTPQAAPAAAEPPRPQSPPAETAAATANSVDGRLTDGGTARKPASDPGAASSLAREVVPGMSEADVTALHRSYEDAQRRTGDLRSPMSLAQLKHFLRSQAPKIMQEYMAFGVTFDVAVKENKVVLRAKPIK